MHYGVSNAITLLVKIDQVIVHRFRPDNAPICLVFPDDIKLMSQVP